MGIVSRQAVLNSVYSSIGVVAGAINTIFILPRAFEEFPDDLGLIRVLLAYATMMGSLFGFGISNLIVRDYRSDKDSEYKHSLMGYAFVLVSIGIGILALILKLSPNSVMQLINVEEAHRLIPNINSLLLLSFVIIFSQYFNSHIIANHKSPVVQIVKDPYLKITHLTLCLAYLLKPFSFELFINVFVGLYLSSIVILFGYSLSIGLKMNLKFELLHIKELLIYGAYTVLQKAASIFVNNLDLVMIGYLMNLSDVGYYSIAFFIGSVILIPQKAIIIPSTPLVSEFLNTNQTGKLKKLYTQTSINQLILGGLIFVMIWINIDSLFQLMPDKFAPGKWVVFYIGLSKIFTLSTGISAHIVIYSKLYRYNIVLNVILIAFTVMTNYMLIPKFGIKGAAIATSITFFAYNLILFFFVYSKFVIQPFSWSSLKTVIVFTSSILLFSFFDFEMHPILSIAAKSLMAIVFIIIAFRALKIKAEILKMFRLN